MARMHVHVTVAELAPSLAYYSALFDAPPGVVEDDYAKWELDDPAVNFAISTRGRRPGLDHLGLQADSGAELDALRGRLAAADIAGTEQHAVTCCYARSDKTWSVDPQGIAWETFHTLGTAPVYSDAREAEAGAACCVPERPAGDGCC